MQVIWSTAAATQFSEILEALERVSLDAMTKLQRRIETTIARLVAFPESGRPAGSSPGTREATIDRYVLRYCVDGDRLFILRLRHGARDEESSDPREAHESEAAYYAGATLMV